MAVAVRRGRAFAPNISGPETNGWDAGARLARLLLVLLLALLLSALILLLAPRSASADSDEGVRSALLSSVVRIEATAPAGAESVAAFGARRSGSGVVIDSSGLVLTAGYLIADADRVVLTLADGRQVTAEPIAYDGDSGFGLLRAARPLDVTPAPLGRSTDLKPEDAVLIASADGERRAIMAIVVSRQTFIGPWEYILDDAIFTTPLDPAAAGAALFTRSGTLVGIGSLAMLDVAAGAGQPLPGNMFIPIDRLKAILADLLDKGRAGGPRRPWIGLTSEETAGGRLLVSGVSDGGPCAQAGIRPGDLVVGIDGAPLAGLEDFYRKLWSKGEAGVRVALDVLRGVTVRQIEVTSIDHRAVVKLGGGY
jgi:S1-C subfamily serine protease